MNLERKGAGFQSTPLTPLHSASRDLADSLHKALNQQNLNKDKEIQSLIDDSNKCVKQYLEDFSKEKEQLAAAEAEKLREVNSQLDNLRNDVKEHQSKVEKAESDLGKGENYVYSKT